MATTPDEPVSSDVSAGGVAAPEYETSEAPQAPATVPSAPTAEPVDDDGADGRGAATDEGDDEVAGTDGASAGEDTGAVVPEDFVPVFVSDDLTDTGAHTSATPEPAPPTPQTPARVVPEPTEEPAPEPSPPPVAVPTSPPAPPTPEPQPPAAEPPAEPDEPQRPQSVGGPSAADWAALRNCESSGNYGIDTGNGYFGAYQFSQATWDWVASMVRPDLVGVTPSDASPGDQDALAFALYDMRGASPWPTCGAYLR